MEINDPIAEKTSWDPLKKKGSSFRTHHMVVNPPNEIRFKPTGLTIGFHIFIIVFGGSFFGYGINKYINGSNEEILLFVLGAVFVVMGFYSLYKMTRPIFFNKDLGFFGLDIRFILIEKTSFLLKIYMQFK